MLTRRLAVLSPLLLSACGSDAPLRDFPPFHYDYLTKLQLNVGSIDYADLPPPTALDSVSPVPFAPALLQMARDRLAAGGSSGSAVVTVEEARIVRANGGLEGSSAIRLDIMASDGKKVGFADARVSRHVSDIGSDIRGALYDMTKQMLDDMNVELEFQLRRTLRDYIQTTSTAPAPAAVQQQDLSAPNSGTVPLLTP